MAESFAGARILIVEASEALRADLARTLRRAGYAVDVAAEAPVPDGSTGPRAHALHVVDLAAPGALRFAADPESAGRSLFLAGDARAVRAAVERLPHAVDVLEKPFRVQALEAWLARRGALAPSGRPERIDPLLRTQDPVLARTFARAWRAARGSAPISIEGELGTGRRALARAIHAASPRAVEPFAVLEPGALPEVGAGALARALGERIAGLGEGTLVVVEPEDWPLAGQLALRTALRSAADSSSAPRCLAIVRTGLDRSAREGRLDVALQYHLAGVNLVLPPLRERAVDQPELVRAIARRVARELGRPTPGVDPGLLAALAREGFPGNRLGLESRLRQALLAEGEPAAIDARLRAETGDADAPRSAALPLDLRTLERDTIVRALGQTKGNRTHASAALGISVRTLRNKIREYGLR